MKTILALVALLSVSAFAQTVRGKPPDYCKPCLFYGGDFDSTNVNANVLGNLDALEGNYASVYVPFVVPNGQKFVVTGLFANMVSDVPYISPAQIEWSISSGVSEGNPGTLIASGHIQATYTPTGRIWLNFTEYTALGRLNPMTSVTLSSGVYWESVVPVCKTPDKCVGSPSYFLSDVEDLPAPNAKGIEPNNRSYYYAPNVGYNYTPTWGKAGACGGKGCNRFSIGLLGHAQPAD